MLYNREMNAGPRSATNAVNAMNAAAANFKPAANAMFGSSGSSSSGSGITDFLTGWGGIAIVVIVLILVFAIYYQTIGYYIQIGWSKLQWSHQRGEKIDIEVPGSGLGAHLRPSDEGGSGGSPISNIASELANAVGSLESDVESALGVGSAGTQVFNVARNLYTFEEAEPLCKAFGAELATYDQVKSAYEKGADWCNYGWVKGQLAVYPTQQSTYDKLQQGPQDKQMSCGIPGVNGGFFPNAEQRFGVNCYGPRPTESALDERQQFISQNETKFDREVNAFKAELSSIAVNPWSPNQWSG